MRRSFADREKALAYLIRIKQEGFFRVESEAAAQAASGKPTVAECAASWIARHESRGIGFFQVRTVLNRLVARLGKSPVEADGSLPFHWKTAERFCRTGVIAAVKVGRDWHTTPEAVRAYFWDHANQTFKKAHR